VSTHYMDEAERCHRLAILDRGVLVADGSPAELTGAIAGQTLAVVSNTPRRARKALMAAPGVISAAQVGNTLRVLTAENGDAAVRLQHVLHDAGLDGEIAASEPNLEDVFVAATRGKQPAAKEAA